MVDTQVLEDFQQSIDDLEARVERLEDRAQEFITGDGLDDAIDEYCNDNEVAKLDDLGDYIRDAFESAARSF